MEDTVLYAYLPYHFFLICMCEIAWCWQVGVDMAAQILSKINALAWTKLMCNALQQLWTYIRSRCIVYYNRVGNRVARGYRKWVRVPVWNSCGGRIAPLDMCQHIVPGGITFRTNIYTDRAAGVCRPLSLFILSLHNIANSTRYTRRCTRTGMVLLQACLGQYRNTLARTLSAHMCHLGSDRSAQKSTK